jgi:RNA polymerase sigma-70 factor (ECF subfamily)
MSFSLTYPAVFLAAQPRRRATGRVTSERMSSAVTQDEAHERNETDARLLRRMAEGDRSAFADLYDRFSKPLYSMALQVLREPAEAQDVVHDAFIAIWEKAADFEQTRGNAFSWAVTLTRNRAIDRLRQLRRRSQLLSESAGDAILVHAGGQQPSADETAEQTDEAKQVRAAVATLPAEQQTALKLAFFRGLTQQQIAEALKEPLGTVKARIRRGLLKLRENLGGRS